MPAHELIESGFPLVTGSDAHIVINAKMLIDLLHKAAVKQGSVGNQGYSERYTLVARYDSTEHEWKGHLFVL